MNREIELITRVEALTGTDYFEFLPREYDDMCWNSDSVFLDEEVFTLIEPIFEKNIENFDHYAFSLVRRNEIERIASDLAVVAANLSSMRKDSISQHLSMMFVNTEEKYLSDFESNKTKTIKMIKDLVSWMNRVSLSTGRLTILGM